MKNFSSIFKHINYKTIDECIILIYRYSYHQRYRNSVRINIRFEMINHHITSKILRDIDI